MLQNPPKLTIAFDYDGTYSADVDTWRNVVSLLKDAGHRVICVTGRRASQEVPSGIAKSFDAVIYAENEFKEKAAQWARENVDIWIDDNPGTIQPQKVLNW